MIWTTGRSNLIRTIGQLLLTGRRKANRNSGFDSDSGEHQATPAISTGKCCQNYIKSQNQNFGLNNRTSGKSGHRQHRLMCVRMSYRTTGREVVRITIWHPINGIAKKRGHVQKLVRKLTHMLTNVRPSAAVCVLILANVHKLLRKLKHLLTNVRPAAAVCELILPMFTNSWEIEHVAWHMFAPLRTFANWFLPIFANSWES